MKTKPRDGRTVRRGVVRERRTDPPRTEEQRAHERQLLDERLAELDAQVPTIPDEVSRYIAQHSFVEEVSLPPELEARANASIAEAKAVLKERHLAELRRSNPQTGPGSLVHTVAGRGARRRGYGEDD